MTMVKLEFIVKKFIPGHCSQGGHLTIVLCQGFMRGSKNFIRSHLKMCNKANMVRRFYILMMTRTTSIESRCVGVMKRPPTDNELKDFTKRYLIGPVSHVELQKVYAIPVDIPVSILF